MATERNMEDNYLATPSELAVAIGKVRAKGPVVIEHQYGQGFGPVVVVTGDHVKFVRIIIPEIKIPKFEPYVL